MIFGAWDIHSENQVMLLLSEDWKLNYSGRRNAGYPQSVEHMRLVDEENYLLKIFHMYFSDEKDNFHGEGPAVIGGFDPSLIDCEMCRQGNAWFGIRKPDNPDNIDHIDPEVYDHLMKFVIDKRARAIEKDGIKLTKDVALEVMAKYYKDNKTWLPSRISDHREGIIEAMMSGKTVARSFAMFIP